MMHVTRELADRQAGKSTVELEGHIVRFVEQHGPVTFAGLIDHLSNLGFDVRGDVTLSLGSVNLVVWTGLSETLYRVLYDLVDDRDVEIAPCSLWQYVVDGTLLDLPLVSELPECSDSPCWVPSLLQVPPAGANA